MNNSYKDHYNQEHERLEDELGRSLTPSESVSLMDSSRDDYCSAFYERADELRDLERESK